MSSSIARSTLGRAALSALVRSALVVSFTAPACAPSDGAELESEVSLYALVATVDGVSFAPPLGPEPAVTGVFDPTLLARLEVVLEAVGPTGQTTTLDRFGSTTSPRLVLLAAHELYWMNVPAARYFTDPSLAYRFRALLDGREIGRSDMSARIFEVMRYVPSVPVGVKLRLEARPSPSLARLEPASRVAGSADFALTVSGAGFVHDSTVHFAGTELATTWVSATELTAEVPATLVASIGTAAVTIATPAPGGGTSAALTFAITNPGPAYTVTPSGSAATFSPASNVSVYSGNTASFSVQPAGSTGAIVVGGTCPMGSWIGTTYATGPITASCGVTFTAVDPDHALLGHWSFDDLSGTTIRDASGWGHDLTGNVLSTTAGRYGRALQFDGSHTLELPAASASSAVGTIEFWLATSDSSSTHYVWDLAENGGREIRIFIQSGGMRAYGYDHGAYQFQLSGAIPDAGWHHYALTYQSNDARLYVDGVLAASDGSVALGPYAPVYHSLGYYGLDPRFAPFAGQMDEVKEWSRVLSATEIAAEYAANATRAFPSITLVAPTTASGAVTAGSANVTAAITSPTNGPISAWVDLDRSLAADLGFDAVSGTTVSDASSFGRTATLYGSASILAGRWGGALGLNGSGQWAEVASPPGPWNQMTIEAWIYPTSLPSYAAIFTRNFGNGGRQEEYGMRLQGSRLMAEIYTSTRYCAAVNVGSFSTNTWHHVAMVLDVAANTCTVYQNGAVISTTTPSFNTLQPATGFLSVGRDNRATDYFPGRVDELRIWSRALSRDEILSSYDAHQSPLARTFTGLAAGSHAFQVGALDATGGLSKTGEVTFTAQ